LQKCQEFIGRDIFRILDTRHDWNAVFVRIDWVRYRPSYNGIYGKLGAGAISMIARGEKRDSEIWVNMVVAWSGLLVNKIVGNCNNGD